MKLSTDTLKCLSIGTPNIINFPFVSNGKLMIFRCPNIQTDYNEAVLCLNFGTPENNEGNTDILLICTCLLQMKIIIFDKIMTFFNLGTATGTG